MIDQKTKTLPSSRAALAPYVISAVAVAMIILLLSAIIFWQEHRQNKRAAETTTTNAALILSSHINGVFDKADMLLQAVEYQYQNDNVLGILEARRFNDYLMRALKWSQNFDNIGFIDAKGIYRFGKDYTNPMDLSDRNYFKVLRDRPNGSGSGPIHFSEPILTRTSKHWTLVISRRIEQPDGSFGGIIFIRWDIDRLSKLMSSIQMGPNGTIVLRSDDLVQISRYLKWILSSRQKV